MSSFGKPATSGLVGSEDQPEDHITIRGIPFVDGTMFSLTPF